MVLHIQKSQNYTNGCKKKEGRRVGIQRMPTLIHSIDTLINTPKGT
jgi:hypothetical protein